MAYCCSLKNLKSISNSCKRANNLGGIRRILVGQMCNFVACDGGSAMTIDSTTGKVTSITPKESFVEFKPTQQQGSMTSTLNVNDNGSVFVSTSAVAVFDGVDETTIYPLEALFGVDVIVIVEDMASVKHLFGAEFGARISAGENTTGTAMGDRNQVSITITADETHYPYIIDSNFNIDNLLNVEPCE